MDNGEQVDRIEHPTRKAQLQRVATAVSAARCRPGERAAFQKRGRREGGRWQRHISLTTREGTPYPTGKGSGRLVGAVAMAITGFRGMSNLVLSFPPPKHRKRKRAPVRGFRDGILGRGDDGISACIRAI